MRNKIALLMLILLASCGSSLPITTVILQPNAAVAIPDTQALTLYPVQWQVMTLTQLKKLVADMQKSPQKPAIIFSLDTNNYNNLTLNLIEIKRYIEEQKAVLTMLKNIIETRAEKPAIEPTSR